MRARWRDRARRTVLVAAVAGALFVFTVALAPAQWFRASATVGATDPVAAIAFGFGFERDADGAMTPGAANRFVVERALAVDSLQHLIVQEGGWLVACDGASTDCEVGSTRLHRSDRHDDSVDLSTLDIAVCALEKLEKLTFLADEIEVVVVAHDMHLARASAAVERAQRAGHCPRCRIVVADIADTPYPENSDQLRTRSELVYRFVDLAARVRDSDRLGRPVPTTCPMPA